MNYLTLIIFAFSILGCGQGDSTVRSDQKENLDKEYLNGLKSENEKIKYLETLKAKIEKSDSLTQKDLIEINSLIQKLSTSPVNAGYVPEQKIDFSHPIHNQLEGYNDCKKCHVVPNQKVDLLLCTECHQVKKEQFASKNYYQNLDSISSFVRSLNK